ncbi:MAG: hypothetical protein KKA64_02480 [Nanoarchaeota archaeon]|nr:hypothetical protein [Nanoarchaeota archaeon]
MECERESKNFMTELLSEEDVYTHKDHQIPTILGALEAQIQAEEYDKIPAKNFITIYETVLGSKEHLDINLGQFKETYEKLKKCSFSLPAE